MSSTSSTHVDGESDDRIVPVKGSNKDGHPSAESLEGRRSTKENIEQPTPPRTQRRTSESHGLPGVREVVRQDKRARFTALLHHVTVTRFLESFYALKREAAPGVDGLTWREYETDLVARVTSLHGRLQQGTYRAQPSKRAYIPKADGRQRPLGIAALEDKIVQHAYLYFFLGSGITLACRIERRTIRRRAENEGMGQDRHAARAAEPRGSPYRDLIGAHRRHPTPDCRDLGVASTLQRHAWLAHVTDHLAWQLVNGGHLHHGLLRAPRQTIAFRN